MRPKTIRAGMALLVVSLAATVFYFLIALGHSNVPFSYFVRTGGFLLIWTVLLVLTWQRQGWTRIVMIALIVWSLGNLGFGMIRLSSRGVSVAVMFTAYAPSILIQLLHAAGVALLFAPASGEWFSVRSNS
jgi:hypothetical protein